MRLTDNFTLAEMTRSETAAENGILNDPTPEQTDNLRWHCRFVLEPIRALANKPVIVTSGYRSDELNRIIADSSSRSQHRGKEFDAATDIRIPGLTHEEVFQLIVNNPGLIAYDQVILESHCTHISSRRNRQQPLIRKRLAGGEVVYHPYT
jgi:hypothetical protein